MFGKCEQCGEEATRLVLKKFADSRDVSARAPIPMCDEHADEAIQSGEYEEDGD